MILSSRKFEQQMEPREPTSQEVDNSKAVRGQPWQCPQPANPIGEGISAANLIPAANSGRCSKCHELGRQVKYCTSANGTVKCDAAQSRDPGAHISHPKMGSQTHGSEGGDYSNALRGQPLQSFQSENPIGESRPAASSDRCFRCRELGHWAKHCPLINARVQFNADQAGYPSASNSQPRMDHQTPTSEGDYSNALRGQPLQSFQSENPIGESRPAASSERCFRCRELGHWAKHCPSFNARVQFNADQAGYPSASNCQPRMDHQTSTSEGDYSNALRGQPCQSLQPGNPIDDGNLAKKSDTCYKCREFGHWAKDCPLVSVRPQCNAAQSGAPGAYNIPEILCPCCGGVCLILTSHTKENPGRKFYKCPGEGAVQCKFFQWCDEPVSSLRQNSPGGGGEFRRQSTTPTQISPVAAGGGFRGQSAISTQSSPVTAGEFRGQPANSTQKSLPGGFRGQRPTPSINSNVEGIVNGYDYSKKCPCGAGPCPVRCARTDKNMGRWFVTCPVRKGEGSCGFFEGRDDLVSTNIPLPDTTNDFPKHEGGNSGRNGAYPCFNCGKEGHWKKDCPQLKGYLNS